MTFIINKEEIEKLQKYFRENPEVQGLNIEINESQLQYAEENALTMDFPGCDSCGMGTCTCNSSADDTLRREGEELGRQFE